MKKQTRKHTAAEKVARKRRREEYTIIFVGGKQKRVKWPTTVDGMDVDEFIRRNADPIWLHQNEMWEVLYEREMAEAEGIEGSEEREERDPDDIPF